MLSRWWRSGICISHKQQHRLCLLTCSITQRRQQRQQQRLFRTTFNSKEAKNVKVEGDKRRQEAPKWNQQWEVWSLLQVLSVRVMAGLSLTYLVSEYGIEITMCEGPSMMPTILPIGEIILVERFSHRLFVDHTNTATTAADYRIRQRQQQPEFDTSATPVNHLPTTWWHTFGRLYTKLTSGIHVGDVIVLQHPHREGTVCKRVLALPGDVVSRLNNPSILSYLDDRLLPYPSNPTSVGIIVPDGHLWVEGDNTDNSADSRNYGPVPAALIVGKVVLRLWPLRGNAIIERGGPPVC